MYIVGAIAVHGDDNVACGGVEAGANGGTKILIGLMGNDFAVGLGKVLLEKRRGVVG